MGGLRDPEQPAKPQKVSFSFASTLSSKGEKRREKKNAWWKNIKEGKKVSSGEAWGVPAYTTTTFGAQNSPPRKKYDALSFLSKGRDRKGQGDEERNHEPLTNHEQEPGHGEEVSDSELITALP